MLPGWINNSPPVPLHSSCLDKEALSPGPPGGLEPLPGSLAGLEPLPGVLKPGMSFTSFQYDEYMSGLNPSLTDTLLPDQRHELHSQCCQIGLELPPNLATLPTPAVRRRGQRELKHFHSYFQSKGTHCTRFVHRHTIMYKGRIIL